MTLEQQRLQYQEMLIAQRGRMFVNIINEGLQALLAAAHAGDAQSQDELQHLRALLTRVLDDSDPKARILVAKGPVVH